MANEETKESEEEIVDLIVHLRNLSMGWRKISKELEARGIYGWGKDKCRNRYLIHAAPQNVMNAEVVDRGLKTLRKEEEKRMRRTKLAKEKQAIKQRIATLMVEEYMQSVEMREKLFSDEYRLLEFVDKTLGVTVPATWYVFQKYCDKEDLDLADAVSIAAGEQEDFEGLLESDENLRLDMFLAERLRDYLNACKEEEEESEDTIDETPNIIIEVVPTERIGHPQVPIEYDLW